MIDALEEMMHRLNQTHTQMNCSEHLNDEICPICKNTGWKMYCDDGIWYAEECKCGIRQRAIMKNRLAFANIPENFKEIRLDSFDTHVYTAVDNVKKADIVLKCVRYWLSEFDSLKERGMGLYMYSNTKGSGKTRMAVSIANELIYDKKCQVKFCTSLQILNEIKSTWDSGTASSERKLLDFLATSEFLIIDDFGTEKSDKPWINERFYQIINERYVNKKVTIFTSNERLETLEYDTRITSRIKERTFQIPFPEESVRDAIAKDNFREFVNGIKIQ